MTLSKKCLIISRDAKLKKSITKTLNENGFSVTISRKAVNLYSILKQNYNILLLDTDINGNNTLPVELIENIKIYSPALPIIALTSSRRFVVAKTLIRHDIYDILTKPVSSKELLTVSNHAVRENFDRLNKVRLLKLAQQRSYDIMLLKEIAESTATTKISINHLLDKIVSLIVDLLSVKIISIMMLEESTGSLKISAYMGPYKNIIRKKRIKLGDGVAGHVAKTGEPLLINNIQESEFFRQSNWGKDTYSTNSLLTVPMKLDDKVVGIINVNNKIDGSEFNENDMNTLTTISNQVVLSIENFKLYAKIKEKAIELEKSNKKLRDLSDAKSELLCNLSHELKTPLTSVIGYLELLMNMPDNDHPDTKKDFLEIIHGESLKIAKLIERILNFFNLETNKIEWDMAKIDLNTIIKDIIKQFQPRLVKGNINFKYKNKLAESMIYADHKMLKKALELLFENAIKFNDDRRKITLDVEQFKESNTKKIRLSLFNSGKRIKDEHIEMIFMDFYQPGSILTDKPEGVGLGLATVQGIFKKHKGTIKLDTSDESGNTFVCIIPLIESI